MARMAGPACSQEDSDLRECPGCPYRGPKCGSRGSVLSDIVFVGEAPGHEEVRSHLPLVGPSGDVFWGTLPSEKIAEGIELHPEDFLILNALQCLPPRSKDARKNTELIRAGGLVCRDRLLMQIAEHPRKLIVAMGNHALWTLTGDHSLKITQVRGQIIPSPLADIGILPVVHPAGILRGTGNYRQYKMDMEYALDLIRGFPKKQPQTPYFLVCNTKQEVLKAVKRLIKKPYLFNDIETTGFNRFQDDILCWGIAYDPRFVYIFPGAIRSEERALKLGAHESWLDGQPSMIPYLLRLLKRYKGRFTWHNGKFDISFSRRDDKDAPATRVDEDTMLLSYALDENRGIHDLEQVAGDLLGTPDHKYMLKQYCPKMSDSYAKVPRKVLYNYLAFDVSDTAGIFPILRRRVSEDPALEKLYTRMFIPASEELWHAEYTGVAVNEFAVRRQQKRLGKIIEEETKVVQDRAKELGYDYINPASPQQMNVFFYDKLKMPINPQYGRSCRKEVRVGWPQTSIVKAFDEYKKAQKNKSTYTDTVLKAVDPFDNRVHPTFMINGTRTGRLAHKVIANIPRDKRIRGMYTAAKGKVFIKADLDQAELRVLACLSGDPKLCEIYRGGRKLHREVSDGIWGKGKWNEDQYMRAKALNFGIIYGRQAQSIADEFKIPLKEAEGYINYWKKNFPVAWAFLQSCARAPLTGKTMVTPFGRKKRHWIVTRENIGALQNEAMNFPLQSIGSNDIVLAAVIKVGPILRRRGVNIVILYHDEMIAECPDDLATIKWAREQISLALEAAPREWKITRIPFKADTYVGKRWGIYRGYDKAGDTVFGEERLWKGTWAEYLRSKIHVVDTLDEASAEVA